MTNVQNLMYDEKDADRLESLKWVDQETKRIARIVNDLLNFSSSSNQGAGETSINRVVEQLVKFSGYSSGRKKIVFKSILPENELFTSISSDELKQVVFNILHNAEQSITGKGEIAIGLEKDGDYAVLTVGDTGCGMDSDTLARIYDPFFTTRKGFGGTGLGLSVVYGIMRKYRGEINFESAIGRGTTVFLRLPLHV
jgi:signal transduction histidine kinase